MKKDIILFGIQGSGKGTQAHLLMEKLKAYQYFEPGNILRALKSNKNVLGEHIKDSMDKGKMVGDWIIFGLFDIYEHLLKPGENMLIDWFLRTLDVYKRQVLNVPCFGEIGLHADLLKAIEFYARA